MVLQGTSGQLGKQLLLKQYAYGAVLSKYPDMSAVKPSEPAKPLTTFSTSLKTLFTIYLCSVSFNDKGLPTF